MNTQLDDHMDNKSRAMKIISVVGTRPNLIKIAPIIRAIDEHNKSIHSSPITHHSSRITLQHLLVHTGQHYDYQMSKIFFEELDISKPDIYLGVGSGTHAEQTGKIMIEFEKVLLKGKPDLVIVVGDVNSTLAAALAAVKLCIPVAHVEAGLRSYDREMPEEINRVLTDAVSDYLFTPSSDADDNLTKEGIPEEKIYLVGDVMIDSLLYNKERAKKSNILAKLGLMQSSHLTSHPSRITDYALLTLHRPSNVDDKESFLKIFKALKEISQKIPIIFPAHPRTKKQIKRFGLENYFNYTPVFPLDSRINCIDPLGYLDFLNLEINSKFVMTDSGGIQEETTVLDVPCLTLRDTTERPITLTQGTNTLVWNDTEKIIKEAFEILEGRGRKGKCPQLWDGKAAQRIISFLENERCKDKITRRNFLVFGSPLIEQPEIDEVVASLKSGWLGTGPKVHKFEEMFRKYKGSKYAMALNSCTAALHLSMLAIGIKSGDEVIVPTVTFASTANAVIHAKGVPVFVDCEKETMNIDPEDIERKITSKTKAILPVHFAGRPCNMDVIMDITKRHHLKIVEDCAHAIETEYHGKKAGTFGELGCFSFYVTKNIVTGEGGMAITDNEEYVNQIKMLGLHGMSKDAWKRFSDSGYKHYQLVHAGFKYNMMDLQAAIGVHQLPRVDKYWERRQEIWSRYNEAFKDLPVFTPTPIEPNTRHAYRLYTLLLNVDNLKITRDEFLDEMTERNIGVGVHYIALHLQPYHQQTFGYKRGDFPNAEWISDRTVSIPLSAKLTDEDVEDVIEAVVKITRYYS